MRWYLLLLVNYLFPLVTESQIYIGFTPSDSTRASKDTLVKFPNRPDADRNDIPFIDYKPAVIWKTPTDSVVDNAYIRKNFTDQMVSVWSHPKRLYPASRIYALDMDGKHYRAVKVSGQNYVFAEQIVKGKMNLYLYRKIPQMNGWIEFMAFDSLNSGYHNNMIVEKPGSRGVQEYFGYFISMGDDSLRPVLTSKMRLFADTYLSGAPASHALAMKFAAMNMNKPRKIAVIGLMSVGLIGLAATGGSGASLIFLAGFPAAAMVAFINKPQTLHWQDMVEIVNTYNKEIGN